MDQPIGVDPASASPARSVSGGPQRPLTIRCPQHTLADICYYSRSGGIMATSRVSTHRLSPATISLLHHVELNKAGWREKGLECLIVAVFWLNGDGITLDHIQSQLENDFHLTVPTALVRQQLEAMALQGIVVALSVDEYKLAEEASRTFAGDVEEAETCEKAAFTEFAEQLAAHCPEVDINVAWRQFNTLYLFPLLSG